MYLEQIYQLVVSIILKIVVILHFISSRWYAIKNCILK